MRAAGCVAPSVCNRHQAQFAGDPEMHENIRVPGSHCGLGFNPWVMKIVADRLAQPEDRWRPYR